MLDPVIDYAIAGAEVFGDLLDGQLLGLAQRGRRNPMAPGLCTGLHTISVPSAGPSRLILSVVD